MKKRLALFPPHVGVGITENESNGREEVTFTGTIATDNNVVFGGERLDHGLVLVTIWMKIINSISSPTQLTASDTELLTS